MWKLAIIDDEAIIRRGLSHALDWASLNVEIAVEAEDGETGLALCRAKRPDILLVDICMPRLSGLDMIKEILSILPDAVVLIISGHGEFDYARQAIKLDVFDFILKPVDEEYLEKRIKAAIEKLEFKKTNPGIGAEQKHIPQQIFYMERKKVFTKLLHGHTEENIDYKLKAYNLEFLQEFGLLVIKMIRAEEYSNNQSHNAFVSHTQNIIINDIVSNFSGCFGTNIIGEIDGFVVAALSYQDEAEWQQIFDEISNELNQKMVGSKLLIKGRSVPRGIVRISKIYTELREEVEAESKCTPIVLAAKEFIDNHYINSDLSLATVASAVDCNPSYLSKLLKKELGSSFVDYLTTIRIKRAIMLINDSNLRINEIAEKVGYNSQHYFSAAFKKMVGVSPNIYRSEGLKHAQE